MNENKTNINWLRTASQDQQKRGEQYEFAKNITIRQHS